MMRSLYSGVSGLNNHQTRMDVIGHNISNVNTHGYKKGRVTFQDLLSQRVSGPARPNEERGGVNPKQIGLGMQVATIDTIFTQGALQTTGVPTDLALTGNGFFVEREGSKTYHSRAGNFGVDSEGVLVNPATGYRIQGYQALDDGEGGTVIDSGGSLGDLNIPIGRKLPAEATTLVKYKSNLNKLTPPISANGDQGAISKGTWTTTIQIQDSRGENMDLRLSLVKNVDGAGNEVPNEWLATARVFDDNNQEVQGVQAKVDENDVSNNFVVRFNSAGAIEAIIDPNNPQNVVGENGQKLNVDLKFAREGSEPMDVNLDLGTAGRYDGMTQFASPSSTKAYFQNGVSMGYLENFNINSSGVIVGSYTNGLRRDLGQVAVSTFTNPGGLERLGETNFIETRNSGAANFTTAGSQGAGKILAGALEMSNVALSDEFTDMIVTQRGFQANSRSITTSDTMLEEILRLKR